MASVARIPGPPAFVTTAIRGTDADERERMIGEIVGVFQETGKL